MGNIQESLKIDIDSLPAEALDGDLQLLRLRELLAEADTQEVLDRITLGSIMNELLTSDLPPHIRKMMDLPVMRSFTIPPRGVEFIIGLIVCQEPGGSGSVTYEELAEQYARVCDAFRLTQDALYAGGAVDEHRYNLLRGLVHRELTTGRFHEPEQAIQAARRCYTPFDAEMNEAVGYTIDEAIGVVGILFNSLEEQTRNLMIRNNPSFQIPDELKETMEMEVGGRDGVYQMVDNPRYSEGAKFIDSLYANWQGQLNAFWFDTTEAIQQLPTGIDSGTFLSVIRSLRVQVGDPEGIPGLPYESPFDGPNPIEVRPILELNGKLSPATGAALTRTLAETYYYRIYNAMRNQGRKKEFEDRWGDILESWTEDVISPVFGRKNIIMNPKYMDEQGEKGEIDFLVEVDGTLLVFECKSKKLPVETRGTTPDKFESHLQDGLGKAVEQTGRFIRTLRRMGTLHMTSPEGSVDLDANDYERYQPIVILRDWYDNIATVDYTEILADLQVTPYVLDIFTLEAVTDILTSPSEFNNYVTARRGEITERRYFSMDELDYLDLYLSHNGSFPEPPTQNLHQINNRTRSINRRLSPDFTPDMQSLF